MQRVYVRPPPTPSGFCLRTPCHRFLQVLWVLTNVVFHRITPKEFLLSSNKIQGGDRRPFGVTIKAWYCSFEAWCGNELRALQPMMHQRRCQTDGCTEVTEGSTKQTLAMEVPWKNSVEIRQEQFWICGPELPTHSSRTGSRDMSSARTLR